MTRRSFCFLFGAGLAGVALATELPLQAAPCWIGLDSSDWNVCVSHWLHAPASLQFETRKRFTVGQPVDFRYEGFPVFVATVTEVVSLANGRKRVNAVDATGHMQRRPEVYGGYVAN